MTPPGTESVTRVLDEAADQVAAALGALDDWGPSGGRPGQYRSDLRADAVAVDHLVAAGFGVLSEESGRHHVEREVLVVVDPLDGSTNAAHGVPWYATSLCAVDHVGPLAALVVDLARGCRYTAVRGQGAWRDGTPIAPSGVDEIGDALVGLSGLPPRHLGWRQFRALGAVALDLCAVADGTLDGFVDCSHDAHGPWDYLGGLLICREAGAAVVDSADRDLVVVDHAARRTPVAAATGGLLDQLVERRRSF